MILVSLSGVSGITGALESLGVVGLALAVDFLGADFLTGDFLTGGFLLVTVLALVVDFLGVDFLLEEVVAVLERRVVNPSIDLFLSIVYNYNIMGIKLTKKQLAVLNFLEDFTEENGYSPSYREIMTGLGLTSVSAVAEHIDNLVGKEVLKKVPGAARSLEVLDYKHEETVSLFKAKLMDCTEEEKKLLEKVADILGLDLG